MRYFFYILAFAFLLTGHSHAKDLVRDEILVNCKITPSLKEENKYYPGEENVKKTNNLRRKTGTAVFARGKFIKLTGRVVDSSCLPLDNAIVEIWHTNSDGFYNREIKKNNDAYDPNFNESGRVETDNLGNFEFLTIYPGRHFREAPHINVKVKHPEFEELNAVIYFEGEKMNYYDQFLSRFFGSELNSYLAKKVPRRQSSIEPQETVYYYVITLAGKNRFKRY